MNEFEPVLFTQFDNDFLIGIAYDPKNAIDTLCGNRRCKRFKYFYGGLQSIDATALIAERKGAAANLLSFGQMHRATAWMSANTASIHSGILKLQLRACLE